MKLLLGFKEITRRSRARLPRPPTLVRQVEVNQPTKDKIRYGFGGVPNRAQLSTCLLLFTMQLVNCLFSFIFHVFDSVASFSFILLCFTFCPIFRITSNTIENYEPRVDLISVDVTPNYDDYEFAHQTNK